MDRTKLGLHSKVNASTILEVVIAMVMIMVVFSIATMIYANVMRSSLSVKKIHARAAINETMQTAINSSDAPVTNSFLADDFTIEQTVKSYNDNKYLLDVDISAYDANQQKVAELHKVIIREK